MSINWRVCVNWHKDKRIFFGLHFRIRYIGYQKINFGSKLNVFHVEFVLVAAVKISSDLYTAIAFLPVSYRAPRLRRQASLQPEGSTLIGLKRHLQTLRFSQQPVFFRNEAYTKRMELSKHIWDLKK